MDKGPGIVGEYTILIWLEGANFVKRGFILFFPFRQYPFLIYINRLKVGVKTVATAPTQITNSCTAACSSYYSVQSNKTIPLFFHENQTFFFSFKLKYPKDTRDPNICWQQSIFLRHSTCRFYHPTLLLYLNLFEILLN